MVLILSPAANEVALTGINPNFRRRRMAQESERAGGEPVSAGLEDADEIANFGVRERHFARQRVERRAERSDDVAGSSVGARSLFTRATG